MEATRVMRQRCGNSCATAALTASTTLSTHTRTKIGFLTVCGPTEDYYEQLLEDFPASIREAATPDALAKAFKAAIAEEKPLLDDPVTDPINNSSVILATRFNGHKLLLTADAG